jgi:hypothetical protein
MDVDSLYKKVKAEHSALLSREKELLKRLEDVKRLKKQNVDRKSRVNKLEAELAKYLEELDS